MKQEINEWNESQPKHKRIKEIFLLHEAWTVESGQLSNTLKPIRRKIEEDYEKEIEGMYSLKDNS